MKRLFGFFVFLLTIALALIVKNFTNDGVDLLVYTWIVGSGMIFLNNGGKVAFNITLGILIAAVANALIFACKWEWGTLDYIITIIELLIVILYSFGNLKNEIIP